MNDDDPKKKLPRPRWDDAEARAAEKRRVSKLLDAESDTDPSGEAYDPELVDVYGAPPPQDPELGEVYGLPPPDSVRVYGAPVPDDERSPAPVYGAPPPGSWAPAPSRVPLVLGVLVAIGALVALLRWLL